MIPGDSRQFTLPNHTNAAFKIMNELRQKKELCDITLCVGNQEYRAHKVVLAGCSPYLRAMFTNGMLESEKSIVEIHDVEPDTMDALLEFMYCGTVNLTTSNVQSLLQGASLLTLSSLRNVCCRFLQLHIDASNCIGIQSFADMYSCMELEMSARQYIYQHFLDVIRHEEFLKLPQNRLIELLQSDKLQVTSEEQVFNAAVSWLEWGEINQSEQALEWDEGSQSDVACSILQHIRLPLLEITYLENVVLRSDFVRNCAQCQNLVANAIRTKSDNNLLAGICPRSQPQGIFVIGGRNSQDCQLSSMERYDFLRDQWVPMTCLNVARTAVEASTLNGMIYAVGGECALAEANDETMYLGVVEAYDPVLKEWRKCHDLNVPRSFISVCTAGKYLYAIGGEDRSTSYNIVERYCYKSDTWSFMPSMKRKRAGAAVAVCEGKIYVAGGFDKTFHTDRASVECYDPDTNEWTFVAEMEKARSGLTLVALDHYIYAFGGRARHNDQYFNIAERYNTWSHQWTSVAPMNTSRAWASSVVVDNKIYVIGGFDGSNRLRSVEYFNPDTETWTFLGNMNACRAGCGSAVL